MNTSIKPVCLTIAGSDSGGGAGIQADLNTFTYFQAFGVSAITAITAQNPFQVKAVHPIPVDDIIAQLDAVTAELAIKAIKTGMLFSPAIVQAVANWYRYYQSRIPLVVDPVMVATSGARLSHDDFACALMNHLIPLATIITPNIPEAETLLGRTIDTPERLRAAATELAEKFNVSVLLKGGHLAGDQADDILLDQGHAYRLSTPMINALTTHGTGCMLAAAIAANLALGKDLLAATISAKAYVYHSLKNTIPIGPRAHAMGLPVTLDESVVTVAII